MFEHPTARVFPVTSGTAANSLALSASTPPWGAVLCHESAHIITAEGGATSLFSGGAVMHGVGGQHALIEPDGLRAALESVRWGDPHESQPSVLSLTLPSDYGTVYRPDEIAELTEIAREFELRVHLDGARIANAVAALDCAPADVTWRAGVDVLSLGATKNGALSAEAIVAFDDRIAEELVYRTKRSGHVTSKMRFQSAQVAAYLTDGLWLRLARHSNQRMAELVGELVSLHVVRRASGRAGGREHGLRGAAGRRDRRGGRGRPAVLPDGRDEHPPGDELADDGGRRRDGGRSPVPRSGSRRHVIPGLRPLIGRPPTASGTATGCRGPREPSCWSSP